MVRALITPYTLNRIGVGAFLVLLFILASVYTYTRMGGHEYASAQASSTLNFQARLLSSSGAIVPDGDYSVEFNLYEDEFGGSSVWSESQTIAVKSGYLSAYLGDVSSFPGTIDWSDQVWLTMNVESDGEMTPRIRLTAVPYAFQAGFASQADGITNGMDILQADDLLQKAPLSIQSINSAVAGLRFNQTGSGNLIQLQGDGSDVFVVDKSGEITTEGGLKLGNTSSTIPGTIRWSGVDFEGYDGSAWVSLTGGSSPAAGTPATATFYDATGGATIASGVFSTISLDTTLTNSDNTKLSLAANEVTVDEDGFYEISYQVTTRLASGTRSGFNAKLQLDDGGGYADVAGSEAFHYGRLTSDTQGTSAATVVLELAAGDTLRLQGQGNSQSFTTVANASSMSVTRVVAAGSGGSGGSGLEFTQGGNAFGTIGLIGTTDNNGLRFITNNTITLDITASGDATFSNALDVDGLLSANNGIAITSGSLDVGGGAIQNAGAITASSISGDGSGLTNLDGSALTTGTIADARLSSNVALLDQAQTYTGLSNFSSGLIVGNTASTTAGALRWSGADLEVYDGTDWVSLTSGSASTGVDVYTGTIFINSTGITSVTGLPFQPDTVTFRANVSIDGLNYDQAGPTNANTTDNFAGTMNGYARDTGSGIEQQVIQDGGSGNSINAVTGYASNAHVIGVRYGDANGAQIGEIKGTLDSFTSDGFDINISDYSVNTGTSGMVVMYTAYGSGSGSGSGSSGLTFEQGGNAFGSLALLGTTDANGLQLITNGTAALAFTAAGNATFSNAVDINGLLTANNGLTLASGNLNMSGGDIQNAGAITATSLSGNGSALTNLSANNIASGTLNDARLSGNIARLNAGQTFTSIQNFSAGLTVGNTADTTAGNIRWNGVDLEVYDGTDWVSLTSGGAVAPPADYISETITANSNTATGPYDIFESGNYPSFSSVTNASDGITYTPADGRFTFDNGGTYNIQLNLFVENSNTSLINIIVRVNGANVFNQDTFVHNVVDPVERTVTLIQDISAGDFVEFLVQGTSGTVTVNGGTSATIVPVSAASGSGSGSSGLTFEQGGNAFGSLALLGTTDANGLQLITNGTAALAFTAAGNATFSNAVDINGLLTANNGLTLASGNLNMSGGDIQNAGAITATSLSGNGSALTNLSANNIASGTLNDARLSGNIARLNAGQTFTGVQTFSGGTVLGNFVSTTAGAIRWTGSDFEGYDGTQWVSLTSGGSASLIEGVLAFGRIAGSGTPLSIDGASVVRNSAGDYTVTLDQPAANSNYTVSLSLEDASNFNDPNIVMNNQTTSSFDVYIGIGDNGGTADVRSDRNWHFMVLDANATAGGGGGGGGGLVYEQGGNAFGATGIIGTTDANGLRLVSGANTALEFDASGVGTFANGFSITSGAVDLNLNGITGAGAINGVSTLTASGALSAATIGDTINGLVINGGSLSSITGYDQASGNFTIAGSGTFSTGTGTVNLNGDVIAGTTLQVNDGLSVAGSNSNVASIAYFEGNITTPSSVNNGTIFGSYTFDADNDPDEAAWTFVSDNGPNGLNPSGTNRAWSHETGDTPSTGVGPASGQGGSPDGYIYTEATSPAAAGDTFTVTNNTVFDASNEGLLVEFYWNQRGDSNLATLDVQTNENGAGWVTRGSYGGGDQPTGGPSVWNFEQLNLNGVVTDPSTEVRFLVTFPGAGTIWNNDFGLDTITITELEPDVYGDNIIEAYNANSVSDVDLLTLRSDVGGAGNVVFRVDSDGDIFSDGLSFIGGGADLAEMYKNNDGAQPGDVVVFVDSRTVARSSAVNQKAVAGIVSTYPGVVLDAHVEGVPVALSGRAPVNFSTQNGSIEKGDYLTSGPGGMAVKATEAGPVIGTAMEDTDIDGSVDVLISVGYYNPGTSNDSNGADLESNGLSGSWLDIYDLVSSGLLEVGADGQAIQLNGLSVGGGINNNLGGISNVGAIQGVTDITAQTLTLAADQKLDALVISKDGEDALTIANDGALHIMASSSNALRIQNSAGDDVFNVDSEDGLVYIGSPNEQAKTVLLVLSGRDEATDPPGVNGAQYYNNAMNRFRCYQENRWQDCISAATSEYILLTSPAEPAISSELIKLHNSSEVWIDAASASQVQLQVEVSVLDDVAAETPIEKTTCRVEYRDAASSLQAVVWQSSNVAVDLNPSSNLAISGWMELPADMSAEVIVRLSCMHDTAANQPLYIFNSARLQLR